MKHSKGNIIFVIFLIILIMGSISTTYYLITKHNSKIVINNNTNNNNNNYFTFKEVSEKDTIDVFREYPINPIDITLEGQVKISGLKNKDVENKINEKLAKLDTKKGCYVDFNYSNVLEIGCDYSNYVTVNLIDGEDLTIEDIFQKDSDIIAITEQAAYKTYLLEHDVSGVDNYIIIGINDIKNNNYIPVLNNTSFSVILKHYIEPDIDDSINYEFSYFMDEVTIYDRFLTNDNLYEKEVTKYCKPQDCPEDGEINTIDKNNNYIEKKEYLSPNNILDVHIHNFTRDNLDGSDNDKKTLDFTNIYSKIISALGDIYNIEDENNYQIAELYVNIYNTNYGYLQLTYDLNIKKFTKDNYAKYLLNIYESELVETLSDKRYFKNNMIIMDNDEIKFLEDNPNLIFNDFKETLYNYIINNDDDFKMYLEPCDYWQYFGSCTNHTDYHELIDEASYAIDLENKAIHMYYKGSSGIELVNCYIPFDIFTLKV